MTLIFITGNKGKLEEVQKIMPGLTNTDIDLDEIQSLDPREVIEHKLKQALEHASGDLIVEDTSLETEALGGMPGPLIKWFLKTIDAAGLAEIVNQHENKHAIARVTIGYAKDADNIHFFEGLIEGQIVPPRGDGGFGWDPIFLPTGHTKTFGEMTREEKNEISMRKVAFTKLKKFLDND